MCSLLISVKQLSSRLGVFLGLQSTTSWTTESKNYNSLCCITSLTVTDTIDMREDSPFLEQIMFILCLIYNWRRTWLVHSVSMVWTDSVSRSKGKVVTLSDCTTVVPGLNLYSPFLENKIKQSICSYLVTTSNLLTDYTCRRCTKARECSLVMWPIVQKNIYI